MDKSAVMKRQRPWVIALVAAAVISLLVAFFSMTGKDESAETFESFSDSVVPAKDTSQSLITPPTQQWWEVVATLGGGTAGLWDADVPDGAKWLGFSSGRSQAKGDVGSMLTTFYVGFDSNEQAQAYSNAMGESGAAGGIFRASGNVVQMIQPTSDYQVETFPKSAPSVTGAVTKAHWDINITDELAYLGKTGQESKATTRFAESLGLSTDSANPTKWSGISDDVDSGFVGKLTKGAAKSDIAEDTAKYLQEKKDGKAVNDLDIPVAKVNDALNQSSAIECPPEEAGADSTSCVQIKDGLTSLAGSGLTIVTKAGPLGLRTNLYEKPEKISFKVGDEYDVVGQAVPKTIASVIGGSFASETGPLRRLEYAYSAKSGKLTLKPVLGKPSM
jgi:hypothetical protein